MLYKVIILNFFCCGYYFRSFFVILDGAKAVVYSCEVILWDCKRNIWNKSTLGYNSLCVTDYSKDYNFLQYAILKLDRLGVLSRDIILP